MAGTQRSTITVALSGPMLPAELPEHCARFQALLLSNPDARVVCELGDAAVDATTVDAMARMELAARRAGCPLTLRGAPPGLRELVACMGLQDVLPC